MATAARVVIVGAGPGGVAAARQLRDRAGENVEVVLVEREGAAEYLPGTIPTLLGVTSPEHWRQRLVLRNVEVRTGEAEETSGDGVKLGGRWIGADAVIAAPGLTLDTGRLQGHFSDVHALWDPHGAAAAARAVRRLRGDVVAVVVSSLPYRCPPAPYGMAMQLAGHYRAQGRSVRVVLTTPEEEPLAALDEGVPGFLRASCATAGVEILTDFQPDLASFGDWESHSTKGATISYDLALVVPPHARSPLLAGLPGQGPLVEVSSEFESAKSGLFVVGDAAATPLPRAADAAAAGGRTAADAVLARLGLSSEREPHLPAPECFVGHGGELFSRISLRYPDGLPPRGGAKVTLEGPSRRFAGEFEDAFARWRALRSED